MDSWNGADATTGNPVIVTMTGNKTVTASFSLVSITFLIFGDKGYDSLLIALPAIKKNSSIMLRSTYNAGPNENLDFGQGYDVDLNGGMDDNWNQVHGKYSTVNGTLKISNGKVTVNRIRIGSSPP